MSRARNFVGGVLFLVMVAGTLLLAPQAVQAATITFDGGVSGTGTTLDTAANWTGNVIPVTTDEALLDDSVITLPSVITTASAATFGDLLINSSTLTSVSLTGTTARIITLSGGGSSAAAIPAGGATGDLLLLGTNVTSSVTIGGGSGSGKLGLALGADGNFDVVNANATANVTSIVSGDFNLTKTGAGTLTLSGVNTFGAGKTFTLGAGTLNINSTTALGSATTTFQINGGTTINNTSGAAITTANANPITINGDFTFAGGGTGTSDDLTFKAAGAVGLGGATRTITTTASNSTLGFLGIISNGGIIKSGAGSLLLSGANNFSGGLNIQNGTVRVGNATGVGAGTVTIGNTGTAGTLDLNGQTETIIALATAGTAGSQTITNSSASANAVLSYTGANTSNFGGVIQDGGSKTTGVTVNNASANLTLSGATVIPARRR